MLGAGLNLVDALNNLSAAYDLEKSIALLLEGENLSHALKQQGRFPLFLCSAVRIGESTNSLPLVCEHMADYYEDMQETADEIKAAMVYPIVVSVMMLSTILLAVLYVLPQYAAIFESANIELPFLTRVLIAFSYFVLAFWMPILLTGGLAIFLAVCILRRDSRGQKLRRHLDSMVLRMPLIRRFYGAVINLHIAQGMSIMLQTKMPLLEAVLVMADIMPNMRIKADLQALANAVAEGASFGRQLARLPYLDPLLISMAKTGEELGNMADSFAYAQKASRYKLRGLTRTFNKLLEPAITVVLGVVLALIMLSIILPTFALTDLA